MSWLHNLLNTVYGQKMSTTKYKSIYTNITKTALKVNALDLVNEWILNKIHIASYRTISSDGSREMKDLLKKENSRLVVQYGTGYWEQLDSTEDLKEYMNH